MTSDERNIYLTPDEKQATRLPDRFTWQDVGFYHNDLANRIRATGEAIKDLTGSPVVTVDAMSRLAIEQHCLISFAGKLEAALIGRAYSQMESGGVITQFATASANEGVFAEQLAAEAQAYLGQYSNPD